VAFSARNGLMQVYYNGVLKAQAGIHTPVYHSAVTYSSDPWHSEGKFLLKNLKYYTRFLNPSEVRTVMLDSTPMVCVYTHSPVTACVLRDACMHAYATWCFTPCFETC